MRSLVRLLALTLGIVLLPGVSARAAEPAPSSGALSAQVRSLQADVDRAGREMESGARAYEQAAQRLAVLTQQQFAVAADLDRQRLTGTRTRSGVDALVRAAYKGGGVPPVLAALLSGDPRTLSDLARVRETVGRVDTARRDDLARLVSTRERTARLLQRRAGLRRQALAQEQALDRRREQVAASAVLLSRRLSATATALDAALAREAEQARLRAEQARLRAEQAERARQAAARAQAEAQARAAQQSAAQQAAAQQAAAQQAAAEQAGAAVPLPPGIAAALPLPATGTGGCAPAAPHGYANGFLPDAVLCALPGRPGQRLRTDAARAFAALEAARTAAGLPALCVTDSYRDYAGQVSVFARKPALAAVPGRSQHGWGLAVDLCGGAERFDGEAHLWLRAHAPAYGWQHPAWAGSGGSRPEPWHWEYGG